MAGNDLAIRFTEEKYLSKTDVMKELKTSLIDNIWNNIVDYRKGFYRPLGISGIDSHELKLCFIQSLISKTTQVEMKLLRVMRELSLAGGDYNSLEFACYINCLKNVAINNKLSNSDASIRMILRGEIKTDPDSLIIARYANALTYIKKHFANALCKRDLVEYYRILSNNLDGDFRKLQDNNPTNRVLIDRIYSSAPVQLIEPMLDKLFNFINNSPINSVIKASIVYYYINLVKPFDKYSDEVAILAAKHVIASESMGELVTLLPFENVLSDNTDNIAKIFSDCQKYQDITYFIFHHLDLFDKAGDELLDFLAKHQGDVIKEEFYSEDKTIFDVKNDETVQFVTEEEPKFFTSIEPEKEEKSEQRENQTPIKPTIQEKAIKFVPDEISDKEASRLATHLLELDPSLKKGEAHFYARHCTLGKKYTIQQFKRCNGCAYETARTGMEHLAELGYYRKEAVKNKFVYSPIAK